MNKTKYYKAIRLDGTSHHDQETTWEKGVLVEVPSAPADGAACGPGIHVCDSLLTLVGLQQGPSRYIEVEPLGPPLGGDAKKVRFRGATMLRELSKAQQDKLAGFKLWEVNHPHHPLAGAPREALGAEDAAACLRQWASVWASVGDSVRASVGDSVWAYTGGLFPAIASWRYAEALGSDPWRPLLRLWYAGYVPSFDGTTWRLHRGPKAEIVHEWKP